MFGKSANEGSFPEDDQLGVLIFLCSDIGEALLLKSFSEFLIREEFSVDVPAEKIHELSNRMRKIRIGNIEASSGF